MQSVSIIFSTPSEVLAKAKELEGRRTSSLESEFEEMDTRLTIHDLQLARIPKESEELKEQLVQMFNTKLAEQEQRLMEEIRNSEINSQKFTTKQVKDLKKNLLSQGRSNSRLISLVKEYAKNRSEHLYACSQLNLFLILKDEYHVLNLYFPYRDLKIRTAN